MRRISEYQLERLIDGKWDGGPFWVIQGYAQDEAEKCPEGTARVVKVEWNGSRTVVWPKEEVD